MRQLSLLAAITITLGISSDPGLAEATAPEKVVAVHIVSRVGAKGVADQAPKRTLATKGATLYAVVETRTGRSRRFYSDVKRVRIDGAIRRAKPIAQGPRVGVSWFKVEPTKDNLSNTASGRFRIERIEYREVAIPAWDKRTSVAADVRPTLTPYRGRDNEKAVGPGVGTMRYSLKAQTYPGELTTPGPSIRRRRGRGGLDRRVHRITLRRDNTYLGYLTEMYGQPYIWASAGATQRSHQSERLEGSDCADFVVFGWRRLGHDVPYTWTGELHRYSRLLAKGTRSADGVYRDRKGRALPYTRVGDLLLFPRHVGVLVADRGVPGVLDQADIMVHTLFESPREQALIDTGYADKPLQIRRWTR